MFSARKDPSYRRLPRPASQTPVPLDAFLHSLTSSPLHLRPLPNPFLLMSLTMRRIRAKLLGRWAQERRPSRRPFPKPSSPAHRPKIAFTPCAPCSDR